MATDFPAFAQITPVKAVVVVLPFVPVIAITLGSYPCNAFKLTKAFEKKSSSPQIEIFFCFARSNSVFTLSSFGESPGLIAITSTWSNDTFSRSGPKVICSIPIFSITARESLVT